ncbi:MAG: potassium transporter TrkG [Rhodovibrionaceae bacterium]|nr:potassium transporter TrkG [Rhodovibrionaceae bacterium]
MLFSPSVEAVRFAAHPAVVAKYVGLMLLVLGLLILVPLGVSILTGTWSAAWRYAVVVLALVGLGASGNRLKVRQDIQRNEALAISALMFVIPPFFMAFPLMGYGLSFEDALFEAVSGVTTTGLTTLENLADMPAAFLFSRAWMQWVGGLGVVVLALALILQPGTATAHLGFAEREAADVVGGTRSHARKVAVVYLALTLLGFLLLVGSGASLFDSLTGSLTAISTGGFANYDDSLAGFSGTFTPHMAVLLSVLGAVTFTFYYRPFYGQAGRALRDSQLWTLVAMLAVVTLLIYLLGSYPGEISWQERLSQALITGFSAQSTAGFSLVPVAELGSTAMLVLVVAMFCGGGLGSTAGGIKVLRLLILVRLFQLLLVRASVPPDAKVDVRLDGKRLQHVEIEASIAVILGYVLTIVAIWLVFLAYGYEPLPALFEVTSAVSTTGLSADIVGPALSSELKYLLCFGMLAGRVETAALIVLLFPWTWIGKRRNIQ